MRHSRISKSNRHKKLKTISSPNEFNFVQDKVLQMHKEQPVPRKLAQIMEFKESCKQKAGAKQNAKRNAINKKYKTLSVKSEANYHLEKGMTRVPKAIPEKMEKGFLESDHHFLNRIHRMVSKAVAEANLEEHFDVDLGNKVDDDSSAKEFDFATAKDTEKLEKKRNKRKEKDLKRKEKKLKKQHKLVKQLESQEFNFKKDNIQYGDIAHHPPDITFSKKSKLVKS